MLTGKQTLILWAILVAPEGGGYQKDLRPVVAKPDRDALVKAGLIAAAKRGRGMWLEATDKGWAFAQDHLDATLPSRSNAGAAILQAWLTRLKFFLATQGVALADVLAPRAASAPPDLRKAYLAVTGGGFNHRVRLSDLRARLADPDRAAVDAALTEAHGRDGWHLSSSDNPPELTAADHAAALNYKGERMYFLWITR